jgi:3',5'-nucleoside bisphosphate phosphatase
MEHLHDKLREGSRGLLDFHSHSTHSDGTRTPKEVVEDANAVGVTAMALTDHHIISGLEEFVHSCNNLGIFPIPFGTEICAELPAEVLTPEDNEAPDLIILGKNPRKECMRDYQQMMINDIRTRFFPQSIKALESIGFKFSKSDLREQQRELETQLQVPPHLMHEFIFKGNNFEVFVDFMNGADQSITREELVKRTLKYVNKYIYAVGCPGYVKRIDGFNVDDAIRFADAINGKLIIAHPGGEYGALSGKILDYYIRRGITGIEVRSYFNSPEQNEKFDRLAREYKLTRSGGSDYHGPTGAFKIGINNKPQNQLPKDILEELWFSLPE